MRESKTNVATRPERNQRFRVTSAKTAPRSSAILAKFYDVCSCDVQSPQGRMQVLVPVALYGALRHRYEPHGFTEKGDEMMLRMDRGPTARETYMNLKILRYTSRATRSMMVRYLQILFSCFPRFFFFFLEKNS